MDAERQAALQKRRQQEDWIDTHRETLRKIGLLPECYLDWEHWEDFLENGHLHLHLDTSTGFSVDDLSQQQAGQLATFLRSHALEPDSHLLRSLEFRLARPDEFYVPAFSRRRDAPAGPWRQLPRKPGEAPLWFGRITQPHAFASPCHPKEFALFLVIGDKYITPDMQAALSQTLVLVGCRYAVCFGQTSATWDESIDMACVLTEIDGTTLPPVMTTWHDDEPIEEAAEFFAVHTTFEDWRPPNYVALVLGGTDELAAEVRAAVEGAF